MSFEYKQSNRLNGAAYDVRNPKVRDIANRIDAENSQYSAELKAQGKSDAEIKQTLLAEKKFLHKWHIGNPPVFGLQPPDEITQKITQKINYAYSASPGMPEPINAVFEYHQQQGLKNLKKENIWLTDGISEGIRLILFAALNPGDEILLPTPNYPLWRLGSQLADAIPVHYICDEKNYWYPDIEDIKRKINGRTKGIVLINPNNPTGSVYPKKILLQILEIARQNHLIVFSDEAYSETLYDNNIHIPIASLADDVLVFTFNGLSKNRLMPGLRTCWFVITGPTENAVDLINGLHLMTSARLCSNTFGQNTIPIALPESDYIKKLVAPGGRLYEQMNLVHQMVNEIPGLSCVKPQGGLYVYVKMDERFNITNDEQFVIDLLNQQRIQIVQGSGFDDRSFPCHFRIVYLAPVEELKEGLERLKEFFKNYKQ